HYPGLLCPVTGDRGATVKSEKHRNKLTGWGNLCGGAKMTLFTPISSLVCFCFPLPCGLRVVARTEGQRSPGPTAVLAGG
uniref:Uncharacterized protein n=1 Tax=Neovison vison TaxID=452646 RepID=A0A8C7A939_NEOVI